MNRRLQVIAVAYDKPIHLRGLIDSFLLQTCPDWILHVVHDGPATEEIKALYSLYNDPRINFIETKERLKLWGHPNRKWMLEQLKGSSSDYVLITNDDNYYVPIFVAFFLSKCTPDAGFVYCDTLHSYMDYDVLKTQLMENHIDMGSFVVRLDVAKKVGFTHVHEQADGTYAEECVIECYLRKLKINYIPKALFVHN